MHYRYIYLLLLSILGVSTGGVAFSLVGLSYLMIGLIDKFGLDRTFQILSGVFLFICLVAAQAFVPTDFATEEQNVKEAERKNHKIYLTLLKNKQLCVFLFANFIYSFSYSVSYVHQVMKFNFHSFTVFNIYSMR